MIFVTVGHQMPFDRLVRAVDAWAGLHPAAEVFAQIGRTPLQPRHLRSRAVLEPEEFEARMRRADQIVAHAGMGTILTALRLGKPLLVLPRRVDLGETRNDHQVATARRFAAAGRLHAVYDETELAAALDALSSLRPAARIAAHAEQQLLDTLRRFVAGEEGES